MMTLLEQLSACRFLPVVTAQDVDETVMLASALSQGGMTCMEITLRTPAALECIHAVKVQHPGMLIAAGTVLNGVDARAAREAGADFCVSPGITEELLNAMREMQLPYLPGVSTASEVMLGLAHNLQLFKLFPAVAVGGIDLLKSMQGPFPNTKFCPTGGLTQDNYRDFLALPNVVACGGSWMVAPALVKEKRWDKIEKLASEAIAGN